MTARSCCTSLVIALCALAPATVRAQLVPVEATAAASLVAEAPPPATAQRPPPDVLLAQIDQLDALLAGRTTADIEFGALFRVDVLDESAVAARIPVLRQAISGYEAERTSILAAYLPAPVESVPAEGEEAGLSGAEESASAPLDVRVQAVDREQISPADRQRVELLDLLVRRDGLRRAFLGRPLEERRTAFQAVAEQRRLAAERAAAEAARLAAEEAAARAQEARQAALRQAEEARSAVLRELASERAAAEEARRALAGRRQVAAEERLQNADVNSFRQELARNIEAHIEAGDLSAVDADDLYDQAVDALGEARADLAAALDALRQPSRYPEYLPGLAIDAAAYRAEPLERDALVQVVEAFWSERADAVADEQAHRRERVDALYAQVVQLYDDRLSLLPSLSRDKRERVMGLGPQGLRQLGREVGHLHLMSRWYIHSRGRHLREVPTWLLDVVGRSSSRNDMMQLLVLVVFAGYVYRRRRELLTRVNRAVRGLARERDQQRAALAWLRWINGLADEVLLLLAFWLGFALLERIATFHEVRLVRQVVLTYLVYRLALAACHQLILSVASVGRAAIPQELSDRILRSARMVGRYVFGVTVFLLLSSTLLGRGYLYGLVKDFAWLGAIPLADRLLRRWRDDVLELYLRLFPRGRLAQAIPRYRGRLTAVVVVVPALVLISAYGFGRYVRHVALRFERIRKALAYLFRRQLETKAEAVGRGTDDVTTLPVDLQQAFDRAGEGGARVALFPGLDEVLGDVARFATGGPAVAVGLVGVRGSGKTTWLEELQRRVNGLPVTLGDLGEDVEGETTVCRVLCPILGLPHLDTADALCLALLDGPRRVVLLDHGENLALRAVGGTEGFKAFARVVRRTGERVLWVVGISRYVWEFLEFAARGQDVFQKVVMIRGWPEERIRELVESRLAAAGYEADFTDLLDDDVHEMERAEQLERTRERYLRLLWDYTDGIPALALHFWLRSLVPTAGGRVRVRLFEGPRPDRLEGLAELSRFVLNAVISHEELTLDRAVRVLHYSPDLCLSVLEMLRAQGYLERLGDRYRVALQWDRAAVRYLRRKHLLYT